MEPDWDIISNVYCVKISKWVRGHFFSLSRRNARRRTVILIGHVPSTTAASIHPSQIGIQICQPSWQSISRHLDLLCSYFHKRFLPWRLRHCMPSKHLYCFTTHNATVRIVVRAWNLTTIILRTGYYGTSWGPDLLLQMAPFERDIMEHLVARICCCRWHC